LTQAPAEWVFHLSGGRLCLDFANTVSWRRSEEPIERLNTYRDLVAWSRQAGILPSREANHLARAGSRRPGEAAKALRKAVELRELIYRICSSIAGGGQPRPADLVMLNARLHEALGRLQVVPKGGRFSLEWPAGEQALARMLWPTVRSAAELLTSADLKYLRTCAANNCGWIFLDTSRNRSRRWCDMRVCGNRAKVRRHFDRSRSEAWTRD
jgi:predicted RNA-binding Zn ribbon-like protein